MLISQVKRFDTDSNSVFLTVRKFIENLKSSSIANKDPFNEDKRNEIEFLLKDAFKPIPLAHVPDKVEVQPLKWFLAKQTITNKVERTLHRARLVVASHMFMGRYAVNGNALSIKLRTLRMLASIIPTWNPLSKDEKIMAFGRDVIKAYILSAKRQRLIVYKSLREFLTFYPHFKAHFLHAFIQIYDEVEAGLYWCRTLILWLLENFREIE